MKSRVATLRSIELSGFKSFAKRTKIDFGDGIVAIVGPNGSGKSNIADAVRWVFGEQKNKSLRTDKAEDLIYNGSDNKPRASMAEVVIALDNSGGSIPIDLVDVEITRRLYRSGESSYLLNGKKTSLSAIQELLVKSGFGVGSYTVIGQGMVDKLILSSGLERKQLFEEASGIRQFEIKQNQTTKRIEAVNLNISQISSIINEIKPRQESLVRQASLLQKRNQLADNLYKYRCGYIVQRRSELKARQLVIANKQASNFDDQKKLQAEMKDLEAGHAVVRPGVTKNSAGSIGKDLDRLELQRSRIEQDISTLNATSEQINSKLLATDPMEQSLRDEILSLQINLNQHLKNQKSIEAVVANFESKIKLVDTKVKFQTDILDSTRKALGKSQKTEYLRHSLGLVDILQDGIKRNKSSADLDIVFYKLRRMIKHSIGDNSAELALKVGKVQNIISGLLDERESINESQTNEVIKLRAIEMDYSAIARKVSDHELKLKQIIKSDHTEKLKNQKLALESKIQSLTQRRDDINIRIGNLRQGLVAMVDTSADVAKSEYYGRHEAISNRNIELQQAALTIKAGLDDIDSSLAEIAKLQLKWSLPDQALTKVTKESIDYDSISRIEAEVDLLAEISPSVAQEVRDSSERIDYLEKQKLDLEKTVQNLSKVSGDTSKKMQAVFQEGFHSINRNFSEHFKELFGGGDAGLELKRSGEDYGVEIIVRLPGKRAQNISSLSGGEKALASVALLAGILASNPSPFVVLDEVDAALDDINTKKFADVLKTITKHSQVLVVTHNHETMAVANELMGVTTSGTNDSQIIRVKLDSLPAGAKSK